MTADARPDAPPRHGCPADDHAAEPRHYRAMFVARLPQALGELRGSAQGIVEPPPTVVWSGLRAFDLGNERQRMSLYRIVLAEGMRADLCALLDRETLVELWPTLRGLVSTTVRDVWEEAFAELREAARTGVPRTAPAGAAHSSRPRSLPAAGSRTVSV